MLDGRQAYSHESLPLLIHAGMSGKITDEMIFQAERRMKVCETIIAAMSDEERSNPELIVAVVSRHNPFYPHINLPTYLSIHVYIYLYIYLSTYLTIYLSNHLRTYLPIYLPTSIYPPTYYQSPSTGRQEGSGAGGREAEEGAGHTQWGHPARGRHDAACTEDR